MCFLDAPSHLYKRVCPSVGPSVRRSVRRMVRPQLFSKVKRTHTRRILCRVSGLVPRGAKKNEKKKKKKEKEKEKEKEREEKEEEENGEKEKSEKRHKERKKHKILKYISCDPKKKEKVSEKSRRSGICKGTMVQNSKKHRKFSQP